ncbi:MAG: hydantoinase B/oxoprolinase family protein [Dehalococcoidia bacterium]
MVANATRTLDPVTLEVIRNALPAISDEMSFDLQRTSYNMMIYEVRDYCTALLDTEGKLISQNIGGVSHFVADLGVVIKDGVRVYGLDGFAEGDVIVHNHQASAGQHLNNVVVYTPFFLDGELLGFSVCRAHWTDIGGHSTWGGASGPSFDPWTEGLQLNQLKVYEAGVPNQPLMRIISDNVRDPAATIGDMRSQLAACRLGERRFIELLRRYGKDTVMQAIETIYQESEAKCRAAVEAIPDGVYEAENFMDGDAFDPSLVRIHAKVTVSGSDMTIDFSGCSGERRSSRNSRTYAGAYIAYKALTTPLEPVNEGSFAALRAIIPEGNIMMARYPAPMSGWSGALPTVVDTVLLALAKAIPDKVPAAHSQSLGGFPGFQGYYERRKAPFVLQTIESGGWGGRPFEDGESGSMSVCQGDVRNSPIETLELKCPLVVVNRGLRPDSGGAGKYRGGLGLSITMRGLQEGRWGLAGRRSREVPPTGLWGGKSGGPWEVWVKTPDETEFGRPGNRGPFWPEGTEVLQLTGGGCGWGNPLERDTWRVLEDVVEGYISIETAAKDYGVVISADGKSVDEAATARLRAELAAATNGTSNGH